MTLDRATDSTPAPAAPPWWMSLLCVLAAPAILAIGFSTGRELFGPAKASSQEKTESTGELPTHLFRDWGVPEIALLLTGQTFGYVQPCGCSDPQFGGLVRRYNLVKLLEKKGWKIAGVDLGEVYAPAKKDTEQAPVLAEQSMERLKTTMRAFDKMNYQDFGLGLPEFRVPLRNLLTEILQLNLKKPRALSLDLKDPTGLFVALGVRPIDVISDPAQKLKIGVSSMVGPSVANKFLRDPDISFFPNNQMVGPMLNEFAKNKTDVTVLLVHGTETEAKNIAQLCLAECLRNPALPNIDLIVHTSDLDTAPARPELVKGTKTHLLFMGHKGKEVGVLGIFRKPAGGFELKYDLVPLGPALNTPDALVKDHPVMKQMQDYAQTVKDRDFLSAFKPLRVDHPTQRSAVLMQNKVEAKYIGSEACSGCHAAEFKVWQGTGHAKGFKAIEDAKNPTLRQYDPECVMCHTVGFKYRTGYYDPPVGANAKQIEKHNEKLLQVGCESCHGPGSMHANNPNNKDYLPLINPIKNVTKFPGDQLADRFCQSCHDIENDVHWGQRKPFAQSWEKIAHPRKKNGQGGNAE